MGGKPSRLRNAIRVIHPIKSDQGLRQLKVRWGSWIHSIDFLARKLELTLGLVGDGFAVDQHDRLFLRERWQDISACVSLMLLALGERTYGDEALHHGALFELVFDEVHMVRTSLFKKFLEVLIRLPRLALEVMLSNHDILLVGAIRFLIVVIAAGSNCDPLGVPLLPPFCHLWRLS
jgi:hypothetical protein